MPRIYRLTPRLAQQIAAGEVIERPASVIKELLENSLDAKASAIVIELMQAGTKLIRVRDDGHGIHPKDLNIALQRHTTSKVQYLEDLERIQTLGFRGEALASMASVAKVRLISRIAEEEHGWCCESETADKIIPHAHTIGTTIEVLDLFCYVPARRKFLKSERIELQVILETFKRIILPYYKINFQLYHQQKLLLHYPGQNLLEQRVKSVLGKEFWQHAVEVHTSLQDITLIGWVANPRFSRSQADMQFFYINNRFIKDKFINQAIKQAFKSLLQARYPAYALFLEINPQLLDINVHPNKQEVRFQNSEDIFSFIKNSIEKTLSSINPLSPGSGQIEGLSKIIPLPSSSSHTANTKDYTVEEQQTLYHVEIKKESNDIAYPLGYAIGIIHKLYILAENNKGLIIVDMHAAHERILYQQLLQEDSIKAQVLLTPIVIQVNQEEKNLALNFQEKLKQFGLYIDIMEDSLWIRQIPDLLYKQDIEHLLRDILADFKALGSSEAIVKQREKVLATMACYHALRANDNISLAQMNALLRNIETTLYSGHCNHGRPTWFQLDLKQLDSLFKRI